MRGRSSIIASPCWILRAAKTSWPSPFTDFLIAKAGAISVNAANGCYVRGAVVVATTSVKNKVEYGCRNGFRQSGLVMHINKARLRSKQSNICTASILFAQK